jgi:hypothetical protein
MDHFSRLDHSAADWPQQAQVRHPISFHNKTCDPREFGEIQVIADAPMNGHSHAVCSRWLSGSEKGDAFGFNFEPKLYVVIYHRPYIEWGEFRRLRRRTRAT